jgi:hypothetical protein
MINTIVVVVVGLLGPSYCLAPPKLSVPSSANNCSSRRDYLQIPIFTAMLVEGILVDNVAEAVGEEGGTVLEAEGDECRDGAIVSGGYEHYHSSANTSLGLFVRNSS